MFKFILAVICLACSSVASAGQSGSGPDGSNPAEVKSYVIGLFQTSGRNKSGTPPLLTADNAPAGVEFGKSAKNVPFIRIRKSGVTLDNWLISGRTIFVNADNFTVRNSLIEEGAIHTISGAGRIFDIKQGVSNVLFEDNTFSGTQALGAGVSSAIFQRPKAGTDITIRRNRFRWFGGDIVKTAGGALVEENVFYAQTNVTAVPSPPFRLDRVYGLHEVVRANNNKKHFISLVASNLGNPLKDKSKWRLFDPHYDITNPFENSSPSTYRRNLYLINPADPRIPASERGIAIGANSPIWIAQNSRGGKASNYAIIHILENVVLGNNPIFGNPAIGVSVAGQNWPVISGNHIDANSQGLYTTRNTAKKVNWGVNYDATTGRIIGP